MIDSHCHLADEAFVDDLEDVVARARGAGLSHALCILAAGNAAELTRARRVADLWPGVRTASGVHPHQAADFAGREHEAATIVRSTLRALPHARAIGEIGLDYHYDFAPRDVQREVFRAQVRLARELQWPIIVHTREAEEDTLELLRNEGGGEVRGVLHCFTGSAGMAAEALALGLHISFAGIVTFPKAADLRALVPEVPDDRVLFETDSPYLAPVPHRGKRNEPAWVVQVAQTLADVRGVTLEELRQQVVRNFTALFRP